MEENMVEGSYTVEAAIVMTMVIIVLAAFIYLGLTLHDKALIHAIAVSAAIQSEIDAAEAENAAEKVALLPVTVYFTKTESSSENEVSFTGMLSAPLLTSFSSYNEDTGDNLKISGYTKFQTQDPVWILRLLRLGAGLREEEKAS